MYFMIIKDQTEKNRLSCHYLNNPLNLKCFSSQRIKFSDDINIITFTMENQRNNITIVLMLIQIKMSISFIIFPLFISR